MEKSELEKKIAQRAEKRYEKELENFVKAVESTVIGRRLRMNISEKETISFINTGGSVGNTYFNQHHPTEHAKSLTNLNKLREKLINEYIEAESKDLLDKLDLLKQYLG